ncbi:sterol carrier family protein [Propioniciclava soli]|uniref:sterol carrier family protein n=1 Tax=Propioniciclava soli TaxID=2775081 RepID=UPI001E51E3C0
MSDDARQERAATAAAVRTSLKAFAAAHPGRLVEVRVPPWGAVQVGVPGAASVHRRGTPPNVVETDAATWLALVGGSLTWADAVAAHRVRASGIHADLGPLLG